MINITKDEFVKSVKTKSIVPIYRELIADVETPVSIYSKFLDSNNSFLLESVEKEKQIARYSFIGISPESIVQSDLINVKVTKGVKEIILKNKNPIKYIQELISEYEYIPNSDLPPFTGGAVGYISYDTISLFENIKSDNPDEIDIPDIYFMICDKIIIFDHYSNKMILVVNIKINDISEADILYEDGIKTLENLKNTILFQKRPAFLETQSLNKIKNIERFKYNYSKEEFQEIVKKVKDYIKSGDIVQTVTSIRITGEVKIPPLNIYRALRIINPSPYMFYLKMNNNHLIGASPETMIKVDSNELTLKPIAGTRPIGNNKEEEKMFKYELLNDEKELAEHTMLLDLGRNDANRVCIPDSVHVEQMMEVEKYSHVMHIVSTVKGILKDNVSLIDLLTAAFPAGTVSGAPKIRAMEIINELENVKRSFYAGGVGYIGYSGNLDLAIAIRTMLIKNNKFFIQAGAGIVYDSIPENEYYECMNKAKSLFKAIKFAEEGLK